MKGCLIILAIALLIFVAWVYIENGGSFGGPRISVQGMTLTCRSATSVLTGIVGIGINHPTTVTVQLIDREGRIVIPSDRDTSTMNGEEYETLTYMEGRVFPGTYTARVTLEGSVIDTYTVTLTRSSSPVLTIVCP